MARDPERARDREPAREPRPAPEPDLDDLARDAHAAATRVSGAVAGATLGLLHTVVGWLTLSLGLVAPMWAVTTLLVVWAVVGIAAWRVRSRRPILTMLAPLAVAGLDLGVVALGATALGWNA